MLEMFRENGMGDFNLQPPEQKSLRWNVDHILDHGTVHLKAVYAIRTATKLEPIIGDMVEDDPHTVVFEKGLGANDRPGSTYLLRVHADDDWWQGLEPRLKSLLDAA